MRRWLSTSVPVSTPRRNAQLRNSFLKVASTSGDGYRLDQLACQLVTVGSLHILHALQAVAGDTRQYGLDVLRDDGVAPVQQGPGTGSGQQRKPGARRKSVHKSRRFAGVAQDG